MTLRDFLQSFSVVFIGTSVLIGLLWCLNKLVPNDY